MAPGRHDEMSCRELVGVITDYLEGTLPEPDRVRLEEHVAECPYCEEYIAQMRQTIEALGELPATSLDPRREAELLDAFRGWRRA
ncbi:MAG TPA: zf-HC2 domain-containing protein [Thermoleophilaceae bacterium]|nr:zf-HC2 domain-containing protein [Thermoleophilaceae bacterium]